MPPRGASRPQDPRPTGPLGGVERPRSWRTFGRRCLRRQSRPDLVATYRDAAGSSTTGVPGPVRGFAVHTHTTDRSGGSCDDSDHRGGEHRKCARAKPGARR
jgi:hypothetical protein